MKNSFTNKQGGLIKLIIIVVIAILVLSWFGVDIKEFITSESVQKNLSYVWTLITDTWTNYLATPAHKVWVIWVQYIWDPFMEMLKLKEHTDVLTP
jgi:hypothetical protein